MSRFSWRPTPIRTRRRRQGHDHRIFNLKPPRWDPTIRDQLANLLDDAARRELTLLDTIGFLCEAKIARKDDRPIQMGLSIARFPCVNTLDTLDLDAQQSIDPKQIRELASAGTYVVANNGTTGWSSGPWPSAYGRPRARQV